jgi:hypothetical protein
MAAPVPGPAADMQLMKLPEIVVPADKWDVACNPESGTAVVRYADASGVLVYDAYQLPGPFHGFNTNSVSQLLSRHAQGQIFNTALRQLQELPLTALGQEQRAAIRQAILESSLLAGLTPDDLSIVESGIRWSILQCAEAATNPSQPEPGVQALQLYMDVRQAIMSAPQHQRAHTLARNVFEIVSGLYDSGPHALAMGAPGLLAYLDAEISALPSPMDEKSKFSVQAAREFREVCGALCAPQDQNSRKVARRS